MILLRERLTDYGELPIHDAVRLLAEVTEARTYADSRGVVRRDIKSGNVARSGGHRLVMGLGVATVGSECGPIRSSAPSWPGVPEE